MNLRLIWGFIIFLILAGFRLAFVETVPASLVLEEEELNLAPEDLSEQSGNVTGSSTPKEMEIEE